MVEPLDHELHRKQVREVAGRRLLWVLVALLIILVLLGQLGLSLQIRQTQTDGTPQGKRIVALQQTISDCVNPQGACYKRSRQNQEDVVQALNLGTVYAVYCVNRNPDATLEEVQACVRKLYESRH